MPTSQTAAHETPSKDGNGRPKTSGIKVIGWLLIVAAIVPMAMAAHQEGRAPLEAGLVLFIGGIGLLLARRWLGRRG